VEHIGNGRAYLFETTRNIVLELARRSKIVRIDEYRTILAFHARRASDAHVLRTPQVGLDRHLDQYEYLKRHIGVDHIGLGPDFVAGHNNAGPLSASDRILMAADAYSQEMPWFYVKGFENIRELPNVTQGLLQRGWTAAEVRKVLGENWLRVYEQVWSA